MTEAALAKLNDTLRYHGRRSVDELTGALNADNDLAAQVHKELSLLHLKRFASLFTSAARGMTGDPDPANES